MSAKVDKLKKHLPGGVNLLEATSKVSPKFDRPGLAVQTSSPPVWTVKFHFRCLDGQIYFRSFLLLEHVS